MKSNIFLSYYHEDKEYSDKFQELFQNLNTKTIRLTNNDYSSDEYISNIINENNITNTTTTIVLVGPKTYRLGYICSIKAKIITNRHMSSK